MSQGMQKVKVLIATVNNPTPHTAVSAITNWTVSKGEPLIYLMCEGGEVAFYRHLKCMCFSVCVFKSAARKSGLMSKKKKSRIKSKFSTVNYNLTKRIRNITVAPCRAAHPTQASERHLSKGGTPNMQLAAQQAIWLFSTASRFFFGAIPEAQGPHLIRALIVLLHWINGINNSPWPAHL